MKVAIFNVKYSENLGDGILAQCLEKALGRSGDIEVETFDLAGRADFGATSPHRRSAVRLLHILPAVLRRSAVTHALHSKLRTLAQEWDRTIATTDAIVLGGGNLLQDDDLNFPLKVGTLLDCIRRSGKPFAIFAVGVSKDWSPRAHQLFRQIGDTNLVYSSVRDAESRHHWNRHLGNAPTPWVVPDPGLLAQGFEPAGEAPRAINGERVGICVTDPVILARHSGRRKSDICFGTAEEYVELIQLLAGRGDHVHLFCNGAREDQAFAERIFLDHRLVSCCSAGTLQLCERPRTPGELIAILQSTSVVLAHRLHACIAAYALGIPHVGLGWDQKVASFFRSVGREDFFTDAPTTTPEQIASCIGQAAASGIDGTTRTERLVTAEDAVQALRTSLLDSMKGPAGR